MIADNMYVIISYTTVNKRQRAVLLGKAHILRNNLKVNLNLLSKSFTKAIVQKERILFMLFYLGLMIIMIV